MDSREPLRVMWSDVRVENPEWREANLKVFLYSTVAYWRPQFWSWPWGWKCWNMKEIWEVESKGLDGASLVVQWFRIHLPMQGTRVRALVREDPTCRGATKPMHHNYWACALKLASHNYWACMPQLLKPARLEPVLHNKRSDRNEKPAHRKEEQPPLAATRESPCAATKTQRSQKWIKNK